VKKRNKKIPHAVTKIIRKIVESGGIVTSNDQFSNLDQGEVYNII
jgi:hypothetical protein